MKHLKGTTIVIFVLIVITGAVWSCGGGGSGGGSGGGGSTTSGIIPDSGQTNCYSSSGDPVSCSGTGQDGEYLLNVMSFTDNGDSTVTDDVTGLMWQQVDDGIARNWQNAFNYCDALGLASHSDWRLPAKKELIRIVLYGNDGPAINNTAFPGTVPSGRYWTSTSYSGSSSYAWNIYFSEGAAQTGAGNEKTASSYVRCVRGDLIAASSFTDNGDSTTTDDVTGLMWQQSDDDMYYSWEAALDYCEGLGLAGHGDWRLPNVKELESIVSDTEYNPAIDEAYFPDTESLYYWTSTSSEDDPANAWDIDYYSGIVRVHSKSAGRNVRCVR